MLKRTILVRAIWDPEAGVYVATSDDVPGLVAEAETPQALEAKLKILVPELLELNGAIAETSDCQVFGPHEQRAYEEVPLVVMSEQVTKVRVFA